MINILTGISKANNYLLKEPNIDAALNACIASLGECINIDRCYIFKNKTIENILRLYYVYEWCNIGVDEYLGNPELNGHSYDAFPGLLETLIQDLPLYGVVSESENEFFKEVMQMQGIVSYLFTPIFSDGDFWGWIGFDDCKNERQWKTEEVFALHTVAKNIGIRLNQDKTLSKLEATLDEMDFYMKSSKQAKWEWDIITNEVKFSYNWFGMIGFSAIELEHHYDTWRSRVHPEDFEITELKLKLYIEGKSNEYEGIYRLQHREGHYIWVKYSGLKIYNTQGQTVKVVGTHLNVTELKEKELLLAQQRNEYDHLVNNLAEIIFKINTNGTFKFLNEQWKKVTGFNISESLETNIFDYFEPNEKQILKVFLSEGHKENKSIEIPIVTKKGTKLWVLLLLSAQTDIHSEMDVLIGSITNINDKIEIKNKLTVSEQQYKFIAENTSDLIMQHQTDGKMTYISSSVKEILGYDPKFLIGKDPYDFIHPNDIPTIKKQHHNILELKKEILTLRFKNVKNQYTWLETYAKLIIDNSDNIIGIQTSSRDITDRIKAQEEMKQAFEKERELNELKSGFVSMASHQFRTPLTVIYSNIELLEYKVNCLDFKIKNDIAIVSQRIISEVDRMTELMNNILIFGTYESGDIKKITKEIDFNLFLKHIIKTYFSNERDGRQIKLTSIGIQKKVVSDEQLLIHIITNIVSNAFKYSPLAPSPKLIVEYFQNEVVIAVEDFGIGIPKSDMQHLFRSFYRASNTNTFKGSGLGLVIAKQFTELLQGKIIIKSQENKGTKVTLIFPYEQN